MAKRPGKEEKGAPAAPPAEWEPTVPGSTVSDDLSRAQRASLESEATTGHALGYLALFAGLHDAQQLARAGDGGRAAALCALDAVCRYLNGYRSIRELSLHTPLLMLKAALGDLAEGRATRHPIFASPSMVSGNSQPTDRMMLHSMAAAVAEVLQRKGASAAEADAAVSTTLTRLGYRLRSGKADKVPSSQTIREWRKEGRRAVAGQPASGIDGAHYQRMRAVFDPLPTGAEVTRMFADLVRGSLGHLLEIGDSR